MYDIDERGKAEVQQEIHSKIKESEMESAKIEIMLHINKRLFQQGLITEEMYRLAKTDFLRA